MKIKPEEDYPAGKISEIDSIILAQKEKKKQERLDRQYKQEIKKADELFGKKAYYDATVHYKKALQYKPEEVYPKKRIKRIKEIWEKMQASSNNKQDRQNEKDDEAEEKKAENTPPAMDFGNRIERKTYLNNLAKKYKEMK